MKDGVQAINYVQSRAATGRSLFPHMRKREGRWEKQYE